jgi:large subunit ribosomal protein L35
MPKMKSNSSAKKRFKVTGNGELKCGHAGKRHGLRKRTKKAKLVLTHSTMVDVADRKAMKRLLCM